MNSLLEDIIGFARENLEKAGVQFKESLDRDRALIDAYKSGRSDQIDPAQRQAMTEEYINQASPMSTVGGMIKPSTWAKYTPEAKAAMTEVANRSPQKFKEVLDAPKDLMMEVVGDLPSGIRGQYHQGRVVSSAIDVPSRITLNKNMAYRGTRTPEHELTHYLNDVVVPPSGIGRVAGSDPDDAWTIARLLHSKIPSEYAGSLDRVIKANTEYPSDRAASAKIWDSLMEAFGGGADDRVMKKLGPRTYTLEGWLAKDESLASLAQAAAAPNASPEIKKLAREMGVSFEDQVKEVIPSVSRQATANDLRRPVDPQLIKDYDKMKQSRGQDATFGKFTESEKPGNKILDEMYNRYIERSKNWQRQEGRKEFDLIPKDNFVERVIDWIGGHMTPSQLPYENIKFPRGIGAFRRGMYGAPNNPKPGRRGSMIGGNKMPADETISLLRYLDKYGLLDENILGRELGDSGKPTGQMSYMDPNKMNRLRRLVEEPQAHPSKIKR